MCDREVLGMRSMFRNSSAIVRYYPFLHWARFGPRATRSNKVDNLTSKLEPLRVMATYSAVPS